MIDCKWMWSNVSSYLVIPTFWCSLIGVSRARLACTEVCSSLCWDYLPFSVKDGASVDILSSPQILRLVQLRCSHRNGLNLLVSAGYADLIWSVITRRSPGYYLALICRLNAALHQALILATLGAVVRSLVAHFFVVYSIKVLLVMLNDIQV